MATQENIFNPEIFGNSNINATIPTNTRTIETKAKNGTSYTKTVPSEYANPKAFANKLDADEKGVFNPTNFVRTEAQMKAAEIKKKGNVSKEKQKRIMKEAKANNTDIYHADGNGGWSKTSKGAYSPSSAKYTSDFGSLDVMKEAKTFDDLAENISKSGHKLNTQMPTNYHASKLQGDLPDIKAAKSDWKKIESKMSKNISPSSVKLSNMKYVDDGVQKVTKEVAKKSSGLINKVAKSTPMKVIAGASVASLIIGNMTRSKGQQSNSELYGQRTPYM